VASGKEPLWPAPPVRAWTEQRYSPITPPTRRNVPRTTGFGAGTSWAAHKGSGPGRPYGFDFTIVVTLTICPSVRPDLISIKAPSLKPVSTGVSTQSPPLWTDTTILPSLFWDTAATGT